MFSTIGPLRLGMEASSMVTESIEAIACKNQGGTWTACVCTKATTEGIFQHLGPLWDSLQLEEVFLDLSSRALSLSCFPPYCPRILAEKG